MLWRCFYSPEVRAPSMADGADGWRCAVGIERYRWRGWLARRLHRHGAKGIGPDDSRDPGPAPITLVRSRSEAVPAWGGRQHCGGVWLTRGVRWQWQQAKQEGARAWAARWAGLLGWSHELGRPAREAGLLAGPGAAARASWASWLGRLPLRASGPSRPSQLRSSSFLFLFLFYFSSPLFKF